MKKKEHPKNKFLLHSCCAPCSIVAVDELKEDFELTVFFYNPNIYPNTEYERRKKYVMLICEEWQIPMVDMDYEAKQWSEAISGLEHEPEGGRRCNTCFKFRLAKVAQYAKENNFKYFGTSLTSGRNKKAGIINPIGKAFAKHFGLRFYDTDWKKEGRQEKARKLTDERDIYRQDYCGCAYSCDS